MTELDDLALKLASAYAINFIEGEALAIDGGHWFDAAAAACEGDEMALEALRFLDLAGMLDNHPTNPDLVRPRLTPAKPGPLIYQIAEAA
ncbi:MAG TPA: hypothetical protein VLE43_14045 [Candidatus Saccharimonadia bacterium]|nr:hypothetical protein [Candidatus Saccharimonadia bacterium]